MKDWKLIKDFGIRALLATLVVGGAVAGAFILILRGEPELGMGFLSSAAMGAIGFYFGSRKNNAPPAS